MSAIFWAWHGLSLPQLQGNVNSGHRMVAGREGGPAGRVNNAEHEKIVFQ